MPLSFLKSKTEAPWDRFAHAMNAAFDAASVELRGKHQRHLRLGSPVRIAGDSHDTIRIPIEVRGGARQYAIAYLDVKDLEKLESGRLAAIARDAANAAEPYIDRAPANPGSLLLVYP